VTVAKEEKIVRTVGANEFPIPGMYNDIIKVIPHRFPFLLVDRVIDVDEEAQSITAIKQVSANEAHFQGHFPQFPVMPGVLQIEALAQTAALLVHCLAKEKTEGKVPLLMSMDKVKFRKPVTPGDTLTLTASIVTLRSRLGKVQTVAYVDGKKASEALITAAIASVDDLLAG